MSAGGDFIVDCRRRGIVIECEKDEITLRGRVSDLVDLRPQLKECVNEVVKLCHVWLEASPPLRQIEMH